MKFWEHVSRKYGVSSKYSKELALSRAYRAVFYGNAERSQQQIVLTDLGAKCGFYQVSPPDTSANELAYREGKRSAYAEIFSYLSLSDEDLRALEHAARTEAAAYQSE